MSTWFNTQAGEGKYAIQMETSDEQCYKIVQKVIRLFMDCEKKVDDNRKQGKWEFDGKAWFACSRCGKKYNNVFHFRFCPSCGSDMREVQDGETS